MLLSFVLAVFAVTGISAAPLTSNPRISHLPRQSKACFILGNVALSQEVEDGVPGLSQAVTCGVNNVLSSVPDVTSDSTSFSAINFQDSPLSPLGFSLQTFAVPQTPSASDLNRIQNSLNVYMATEAGLRSVPGTSSLVSQVKVPRFFLMMQKARILRSMGVPDEKLGDSIQGGESLTSVDHQLQKVLKNQKGSTSDEIKALQALAAQV